MWLSQHIKIKTDHGDLGKTESAEQFEPINIKVVSKQRTIHLIPHLSTGLWRLFLPGAPPWRPRWLFFPILRRSWIGPHRRMAPHTPESALGPDGLGAGWSAAVLPALRPLSKRPVLMPQLGKHTLQLAILFYWLMWALGQEELGLNQYSFYYVIVSK